MSSSHPGLVWAPNTISARPKLLLIATLMLLLLTSCLTYSTPVYNASSPDGFDPSQAVEWSSKHCDGSGSECPCGSGEGTGCEPYHQGSTCQCAEFVAHALCHGGLGYNCNVRDGGSCRSSGASEWGSCSGNNLRMGTGLHAELKSKGWSSVSSGNAKKGAAVFYTVNGAAFAHTCIYIGGGKVNCHNNNRCGHPIGMYPFSAILNPK